MQELIDRVKAILISPVDTWPIIKSEAKSEKEIYMDYVIYLAAIPVIAQFLGQSLFGWGMGFFRGISWMIVYYVLSITGVFVTAKIVDALAPTFEGKQNSLNSLKLVAYSMTAIWVIGMIYLIPDLSWLKILGILYSIYLLYLGLPYLMECPAEKTLVYTVVIFIVALIVNLIIGAIAVAIVGASMMAGRYGY